MIIDFDKFIREERATWDALERVLTRIEDQPERRLSIEEVRRFHYLHERTAADLAKLAACTFEPETLRYLDALVARSYAEVHEAHGRRHRFRPGHWLLRTFPRTFRRHLGAFKLAVGATLAGAALGGLAVLVDPEAKEAFLPFDHLMQTPGERVAAEEVRVDDHMEGSKFTFSSYLMTHNTRVSILLMGLGMTWGVGTIMLLLYNGIILGAVAVDYVAAGYSTFLLGWLLPHGSIEIPAFLIAGQAGLLLGGTLIGRGQRVSLRQRVRAIAGDLVTLIGGVAVMLVWAGIVEAFFSQYHEPVLPYVWKIAFGMTQLVLLCLFLARAGAKPDGAEEQATHAAA